MASKQLMYVLFLAFACFAAAKPDGHVKKLEDQQDFDFNVNDGTVWFFKFFAPWCGHCKRLAPTWEELAEAMQDNDTINIAHVDCTEHKETCISAQIEGYHTLKVYHLGQEIKAYSGARELEALESFIEETVNEVLTETTE